MDATWYCCHECGFQWSEFQKTTPPEQCVDCGSIEISPNQPGTERELNYLSVSIECPGCGMPFDVPESVDRWSCDCGESWEIEQPANAGKVDR